MSVTQTLKQKLAGLLGLKVDECSGHLYVPMPPSPSDTGIKKLSINFPTGEMFACDWPQLGRLEKHLERVLDAQYFDLNTAAGREARTRFIAEQFGFVSLFVSNSDPQVFVGPGGLMCAHRPYDEVLDADVLDGASPYREVAQVSTSFWWTTLVDMRALRKLALMYIPTEDVDGLLSDIRSNEADHTFFDIPPGTYTVYFDNNHVSLVDAVKGSALAVENISEPYCIITQDNLDPILGLDSVNITP